MTRSIVVLAVLFLLLAGVQCLRTKNSTSPTLTKSGSTYMSFEVDSTWADKSLHSPEIWQINDTLEVTIELRHRSNFTGTVISYRGVVISPYEGSVALSYQPQQKTLLGTVVIRIGNQFKTFGVQQVEAKKHQWSATEAKDVLGH